MNRPDQRPPMAPVLIGPIITAAAIGGLLVLARILETLPLRLPVCGLRATTGIPCVACGGTRSMMALSHGRLGEAIAFNPLAVLAVFAAALWLLWALGRWLFFRDRPLPPRRVPVWAIVATLITLFAANWIYLWRYLPS